MQQLTLICIVVCPAYAGLRWNCTKGHWLTLAAKASSGGKLYRTFTFLLSRFICNITRV
jgi:hypothetical protein